MCGSNNACRWTIIINLLVTNDDTSGLLFERDCSVYLEPMGKLQDHLHISKKKPYILLKYEN